MKNGRGPAATVFRASRFVTATDGQDVAEANARIAKALADLVVAHHRCQHSQPSTSMR